YEALVARSQWTQAADSYATLLDEAWADDDEGLQSERRRLAAIQATVLERLIRSRLSEGNLHQLSRRTCELLTLDASRQDLLPSIVAEVRRAGGRSSAVRLCRNVLECLNSLDEVPIPELDEAYRASIGSLPSEAGQEFFGRERELEAIETQLDEERCVTLCGPHGIGKTRLAVRLAYR